MILKVQQTEDTSTISLKGSFKFENITPIREACLATPCKNRVVNMKEVTAMDSSAMGFLVALKNHTEKSGGVLVISEIPEKIMENFVHANLVGYFGLES